MDIVFTILNFLWGGFTENLFDWFISILAFWGLLDLSLIHI